MPRHNRSGVRLSRHPQDVARTRYLSRMRNARMPLHASISIPRSPARRTMLLPAELARSSDRRGDYGRGDTGLGGRDDCRNMHRGDGWGSVVVEGI